MRKRVSAWFLLFLLLCVSGSPLASSWGNGCGNCNPGFPFYGPHDAVADAAFKWLQAQAPERAMWIQHWYKPFGGNSGDGFDATHVSPTANDNWLAYTDDPDTVFQDWANHHYIVHPRPGHEERGAPGHIAELHHMIVQNLTLLRLVPVPAGVVFEHNAAYLAGLMAHYIGDLSQFGHTDHTILDHSHPQNDPADRTFHGYYESQDWNVAGLSALVAALGENPAPFQPIADVEALVVDLAVWTNTRSGPAVGFLDRDGQMVIVGQDYAANLNRFVSNYNSNAKFLGMRGYDSTLWSMTIANQRGSVQLLANLLYDATLDAEDVTNFLPVAPVA